MPRFAHPTPPRHLCAIKKYNQSTSSRLSFAKVLLAILSLCSLILVLPGCGQSPTTGYGRQSQVAPARTAPQLTYVAIGASETFGVGADAPYTQNWALDLAAKLGPQVHFIDLGVPGILVHQALHVEVPIAIEAHPNILTVWLAVNDILQKVPLSSYTHDLDLLLSLLQTAAPAARIAVANVPDLTLLPYFYTYDQQLLQAQISAYNTAIATEVSLHHVILVDMHKYTQELSQNPDYISEDGIHPSTIGYARLADVFYAALQAAQG